MITQTENPWDLLAPIWSVFENGGLNPTNLKHSNIHVRDPVLIVGAGQGIILESLLRDGKNASGVDSSQEMIRFGYNRRGVHITCASAKSLPFASHSFESIIIATGVIEGPASRDRSLIIKELLRVLNSKGTLIFAFFATENLESIDHPAFNRHLKALAWSFYCDLWLADKQPIFDVIRKYFTTDAATEIWIRENNSELLSTFDLGRQIKAIAPSEKIDLKELFLELRDLITVPIAQTEEVLNTLRLCGLRCNLRYQEGRYLKVVEAFF